MQKATIRDVDNGKNYAVTVSSIAPVRGRLGLSGDEVYEGGEVRIEFGHSFSLMLDGDSLDDLIMMLQAERDALEHTDEV